VTNLTSYQGDLDPAQTWAALIEDPDAVLIDVRTQAEWAYVGTPDLSKLDREVLLIEWLSFPSGALNPAFVSQLHAAGVPQDQALYFICRSGQRSQGAAAAATAAGYGPCYNVREGFEGNLDAGSHRGVGGWKSAGLPWRQS
jgi:rhodanese-related sulfurtransferase